ncbi:glutamate ABC transporter substrate-binding protein [Amycolatopsis sp. 195334CR]|uniref:glutamate ABC transporter substrate-binding protein n=1 Tax=Amycolatopsis sp. 195334CR TaxID=2814588 RepID=UPI001A908A2F|nr:glutamate ABC transporter substrate-binding protein [Amycolatopsis sp. 195334CR]MBN6040923.1 glutamate ABC transporter substrate-binding protein [Amycolatopsis sp. 195334CR]
MAGIFEVRRRRLATVLAAMAAAVTACDRPDTAGQAAPPHPLTLLDRAPVATDAEVAASPTAATIRRRGQLIVGGQLDLPLLSERNSITGETEGFDATLGKLLAKYLLGESTVKIVTATPETKETLLQVGTVDAVIRIYTITPERAQKVAFAGPYLRSGQAIATLDQERSIAKPADLNHRPVVAVAGTTSVDALREVAPKAKLETFGSTNECVQALESGRAVAYVHDLTALAGAARLNDRIQIVGEPFTSEPYGIGLPRGDAAFKEFVNGWLDKIVRSGLWAELWQSTLGTVVTGPPPEPPQLGSVPGS